MSKNVIEVIGLSKALKGRKVIDNVDLTVLRGDIFGFLGPNGSGKTTTIRMLLKLIYPDDGVIKVNGFDLKKDFNRAIERVGAIVEIPRFYNYLSGRKNLELMANLTNNISKNRVDEVLDMVGLVERAEDKVKTYSLGMKQRLGIANALINNPAIVILDEPTNGLDPQGMKEIRDLIIRLAGEQSITFFISTHLLHEVELMCNRVAILNNGRIIAQGRVEELLNVDYETVEVCAGGWDSAINLLENIDYVKSFEKTARGIMFKIERGNSARLNQALINNGIEVEYLIPHNQSLESFFIETIKGGNENA